MAVPNTTVDTGLSGVALGANLVSGVRSQAVVLTGPDGHVYGTQALWVMNIPSQVHVAVANTVMWDLFNADASAVVRVESILQIPNIVTAVTGVAFAWQLQRTTTVGTGGTTSTPWAADTTQAALAAGITARIKPTGGAAAGTTLVDYNTHSEETNAGTMVTSALGGLEIVPASLQPVFGGSGIVLRQNQGIRCLQITNSAAGNTGWLVSFSVT